MALLYLRPDADVTDGNWTDAAGGTSLFGSVDETALDDVDYIKSGPDPSGDIVRLRLSNPSSEIVEPVTVRYRYKKDDSATAILTARLIQGNFPTTWNPSDQVNMTLSNGNLTATSTSGGNEVRSVSSESAGLKYVEFTIGTMAASTTAIGIANSTWGGGYLGGDLNGVGWSNSGGVVNINDVGIVAIASYAEGDVLCMAINFDSEKIWFRNGAGGWNNDVIGNQNPATNTGGIDFSSLNAGPYFVAMSIAGSGRVVTANFGATAYNQTPPSGFTDFGAEAVIAEWEHTDIAASFVTAAQTLTTPQFEAITDLDDLFIEFEASLEEQLPHFTVIF